MVGSPCTVAAAAARAVHGYGPLQLRGDRSPAARPDPSPPPFAGARSEAPRLRDRVLRLACERQRWRRRRAESRGSQQLSCPAGFGVDLRLDEIIDRDGGFFV